MKSWARITRTLLSMFFRTGKGEKKRRVSAVVVVLLGLLFAVMIGAAFAFLSPVLAQAGLLAVAATLPMETAFVAVLVFGTMGVFSYIYYSRDNEFLLSLPVSPSTVYFAKLTVVYVQEFAVSAVFIAPALIVTGVMTAPPAVFWVMTVLALVLVPVCPLLLCSLIAVPLMRVASFFKNKGMMGAVLLILLFAAFMAAYMVLSMRMQGIGGAPTVGGGAVSVDEMLEPFIVVAHVLYPLYALARFGTLTPGLTEGVAASAAIDLCIFLGTIAVCGVLTVVISRAVYARSALRQTENSARTASGKDYVTGSALAALVKKEWRELSRNTSFAFQCLGGVVVSPVFGVLFPIIMGSSLSDPSLDSVAPNIGFIMTWIIVSFLVQMMSTSMNVSAPTSVTREGVSFAYSKTIPVPYRTQALAKIVLSWIIGGVSVVLSVIAMSISVGVVMGKANAWFIVLTLVYLLAYGALFVVMCVHRDLKRPKLNWTTAREAIKGNYATLVPMLLGMLFCVIGLAIEIVLVIMCAVTPLGSEGALYITLGVLAAACVGLTFVSYNSLMSHVDALYERLTV